MATKARLHWFWRAVIAVPITAVGNFGIVAISGLLLMEHVSGEVLAVTVILGTTLPGIVTYALLTRAYGPKVGDGELHCRKCDHILRGLSEPRCPECGEAI